MITEAVTPRHPQQLRGLLPACSFTPIQLPKHLGCYNRQIYFPPHTLLCGNAASSPIISLSSTATTLTPLKLSLQSSHKTALVMHLLLPKALKTLTALHSPHYLSGFFIFEKQHEESVHKHPTLTKTPHIQLFSCHKPAWKCKCSQSLDS